MITVQSLVNWEVESELWELMMIHSTYEASYDNLPRMLSQVAVRNPGSFYDTYLLPAVTRGIHVFVTLLN